MPSESATPSGDPLWRVLRAVLFELDPERAHDLALRALEWPGVSHWLSHRQAATTRAVDCMGLRFANRVGLAAGLDKNGDHIDALGALGFGHIEIGTVTPRPQAGNPKPRMFRLTQQEALINRMGFNNKGVAHLVKRAEQRQWQGVLGINIGKNAATPNENAADDYLQCLEQVWPVADYITVNISSPNTANLRDLQHGTALRQLLDAIGDRAATLSTLHGKSVPVMVKMAPDMEARDLDDFVAAVAERQNAGIVAGVICGNTTRERTGVESNLYAPEAGGLSGKPLRQLADAKLGAVRAGLDAHSCKATLVGVGGVHDAQSAAAKRALGADLVQIYTGFIYAGPTLITQAAEAI